MRIEDLTPDQQIRLKEWLQFYTPQMTEEVLQLLLDIVVNEPPKPTTKEEGPMESQSSSTPKHSDGKKEETAESEDDFSGNWDLY